MPVRNTECIENFNTGDNLLCVHFRINDIVVCPFSTILT